MSLITGDPEDSPRDCSRSSSRPDKHHHHHHHRNRRRRALIAVSSTVASLLSLALILWLTLRPSSPSFSLLAATATVANNASASATTSAYIITVDAALTAHNPNSHATALYGQLQATASYGGVPLGGATPLMPTPLEQPEGDVVLSAMLASTSSPSPPERALLRVRVQGQLRWKVAAWVSATHGLAVDCIAAVLLEGSPVPPGQQQGSLVSFPSQSSQTQCATHVQ